MHHRPAGPPLSARMAGAARRAVLRAQRSPRRLGGRVGAGIALTTAVTGLVLVVPVVSTGSATPPVALDSSSSSSATRMSVEKSSPVVMGRDGIPAPSPSVGSSAAPSAAEEPGRTGSTVSEVPVTAGSASQAPAADASGRTTPSAATAERSAAGSPAGTSSTGTSSAARSSAGTPSAGRSASEAPAAAPLPADAEAEVLALVNAARADAGCDPLVHDGGLAAVASAHSADMRDLDFVGRKTPEGLDLVERAAAAGQAHAEAANVAHGQPTPAAVVARWLDDEDDRADILDCGLRTAGVGVAQGQGGSWWTQLLGD